MSCSLIYHIITGFTIVTAISVNYSWIMTHLHTMCHVPSTAALWVLLQTPYFRFIIFNLLLSWAPNQLLKEFTMTNFIQKSIKCFKNEYWVVGIYRGAGKSLARPEWKNNWKVIIFRPTRRSLLPRTPGWTDNLLIFFDWLAKIRVWSL